MFIFPITPSFASPLKEVKASYGDYQPKFIPSVKKIIWFRGTSLIDNKRNVWIANPDGSKATEWLKNVESITVY